MYGYAHTPLEKKRSNLQDFHPVTNYTPLSVDFMD